MQHDQHVCLPANAQLLPQVWANCTYSQATMRVVLPNTVLLMSSVLLWMQKPSSLNVVLHTQQLYAGNELWLSKREIQLYFALGDRFQHGIVRTFLTVVVILQNAACSTLLT